VAARAGPAGARTAGEAEGAAADGLAVAAEGADADGLAGADGLALDGDSFVVALNVQDKLARVGQDGSVDIIASGGPLDFPASVVLDDGAIYATAAAFVTAQTPGDSPAPALVDLH